MTEVGGIAGDQLRAYIERIERLEEEKAALAADVRRLACRHRNSRNAVAYVAPQAECNFPFCGAAPSSSWVWRSGSCRRLRWWWPA